MYRMNRQMRIEDFVFPLWPAGQEQRVGEAGGFGALGWRAEEVYAKQFVNNGHPAHPARIALGALILKQRLKCSGKLDGAARQRESVSAILPRSEGIHPANAPLAHPLWLNFGSASRRKPLLLCWQLPRPQGRSRITTIRAAAVRTRAPSSWMPSAVRLTFSYPQDF